MVLTHLIADVETMTLEKIPVVKAENESFFKHLILLSGIAA